MKQVLVLFVLVGCALDHQAKDKCLVQSDCLDGYVCTAGTCEMPQTCVPVTCQPNQCYAIDDGCGGKLDCGNCSGTDVCGGGGTNQCGPKASHCSNHTVDFGESDVDCGGECGGCPNGKTCQSINDCATGTCDGNVCMPGRWTSGAPMPTMRTSPVAVTGADGMIYVIGGYKEIGGLTGVVEVYDPAMNSWSTRASMPTPRYGAAAVLGSDNKIYVIGGQYDSATFTDGLSVTVEAYDPVANTWAGKPSLPNGRYHPAAVRAANGRIYVSGGFSVSPNETLNSVISYAPGESSWTAVADVMTTARSGHGAMATADGRIYAVGGSDGSSETGAFEYYMPGQLGWHTLPLLPTPRKYTAAAQSGGKLYVIGGNAWQTASVVYSRANDVFDPATGAWTRVAGIPVGRFNHAVATLADGRIFLFGGERDADTTDTTSAVDVFKPE